MPNYASRPELPCRVLYSLAWPFAVRGPLVLAVVNWGLRGDGPLVLGWCRVIEGAGSSMVPGGVHGPLVLGGSFDLLWVHHGPLVLGGCFATWWMHTVVLGGYIKCLVGGAWSSSDPWLTVQCPLSTWFTYLICFFSYQQVL